MCQMKTDRDYYINIQVTFILRLRVYCRHQPFSIGVGVGVEMGEVARISLFE